MKLRWILPALAIAIATAGLFVLAKSERGFMTALERSASAASGSANPLITVSSVTDFGWGRLYIFSPYTPLDKIDAQLGYKWREAEKTHIDTSDNFHLLVFVKNGSIVRHFKINRGIDFKGLEAGNVFLPGEDAFEVKSFGAAQDKRLTLFPKRKVQPVSN